MARDFKLRQLGVRNTMAKKYRNVDVHEAHSMDAWPDRFNIIEADGGISTQGGPSPTGFKSPEIESAIVKLLGR